MQHLGTTTHDKSIVTKDMLSTTSSSGGGSTTSSVTVTLNGTTTDTPSFYAPTTKGTAAAATTSGIYTTRTEAQRLQAGTSAPTWLTVKQITEFTLPSTNTSQYASFTNKLATTDCSVDVFFYESPYWKRVLVDVSLSTSTVQLIFEKPRKSQKFKVVLIR